MPVYLDFISVFGLQTHSRDLRFSGFREQTLLSKPIDGLSMLSLGRSGRQYQLCYNLKSVACVSAAITTSNEREWSIRQAAFHHQFDVEQGTTLWLITKGDLDIKEQVQQMTGKDGRQEDRSFGTPEECFKSSLAVHLLYCHWSTEAWRWYLQWLEDVTDKEVSDTRVQSPSRSRYWRVCLLQSKIAVLGPRDPSSGRREYTPEDLQTLQNYEEKTNEATMILEANANVLTSLRLFYERLVDRKDFPLRGDCRDEVLAFATRVDDMVYDSRMQVSRAKLLVRIIADRKNLVSTLVHYFLHLFDVLRDLQVLQHLQSQATEKMEALTTSTHKIGIMSQKEAIAVRIITVVTLIYLPATFVSVSLQ
jgi:Mg2+ and Co2+ transporter CorA